MYVLFIAIALVIGAGLVAAGARRRSAGTTTTGILVIAGTLALFALMSFWGEMLWFDQVGYSGRFWTVVGALAATVLAGSAGGALVVLLVTWPVRTGTKGARGWSVIVGALLGGIWGLFSWDVALLWLNGVETGVKDPILGHDTGFYLFTLPLIDRLYWLLFGLALIALAVAALSLFTHWPSERRSAAPPLRRSPGLRPSTAASDGEEAAATDSGAYARPLFVAFAALALLLAAGKIIDTFHLMYSRWGVVHGPGWTDVHVRLPGYYFLAAVLSLTAAALLVAGGSPGLSATLAATPAKLGRSLLAVAGGIGGVWLALLLVLPLLFQWLRVTPNEITLERPYLANNIAFTRRGFDLEKVEERPFGPGGDLTADVVRASDDVLSEIRLWDPRALQAVFQQFQEIRLYYEMADLDVDRYVLGDRYRQVMVVAREMEQANLPRQSQTFVNQRFKYTHGFGLVMASVHDFTPEGQPNLLVKNIPPVSDYPALRLDRPEIYYGQHTSGYVVANTTEPEFDYPLGEQNVYTRYEGKGGVPLSNFWRKLVYGWKMGGTRLMFSGYPTNESRVIFHRNVRERVNEIAPFLDLDHDPYIVVVGGRLKWIVDAYTSSSYYPYSEPYFSRELIERAAGGAPAADGGPKVGSRSGDIIRANVADYLHGVNYVRNAVKAVVDAYDGDVTFYTFDAEDPILQVWSRVFPGMFRPRAEMPPELEAHIRYPEGFLLAQGLVFAKYHMTSPDVFYNQEDLWIRATERYYDEIRPVDPYYVMWRPPGEIGTELTLIQPFTPKNRQVLIGWLAGLCDPGNYGRLIAYRFPKERWVLGTQQVDTKIDQDPVLSARLSLWDQRGSRVIRGNVLVIPLGRTLLYVEPIYLQAEAAAYPELRVVVLMHGERMTYADTFDEALRKLVTGEPSEGPGAEVLPPAGGPRSDLVERATRALDSYLHLLGQRRFEEAAAELRALDGALGELARGRPGEKPAPPEPR